MGAAITFTAPRAAHCAPNRPMAPSVPRCSTLSAVYDDEPEATARFQRLRDAFQTEFGAPPTVLVRSPGRVNLIGEHIDYEGYSVLPMAIALDTVVGLRVTTSGKLRIANVNSGKYPTVTFAADPAQEVDREHHSWANYFLCGFKGVFDHLRNGGGAPVPQCAGLDVIVDGRVPTGSGLSSSSALVCASSLAVMTALGLDFQQREVAELACVCERYCGTQSGGMDQAISIMGQRGLAKVVHFNPVRTEDVHLPAGSAFVIANSLTVSNKAETAHTRYNLRVVECRLAAAVLALALGVAPDQARRTRTLQEIEPLVGGREAAAEAVTKHLHGGVYAMDELAKLLQSPVESLFADSPASLDVLTHVGAAGFKLHDRAAHVFAEAGRVHAFAAACASGAGLSVLGELMDASHASCRDLYECSCAQLDELVTLAKRHGAVGARLTGAGWGGCAVMLVPEAQTETFLAAMARDYFQSRIDAGFITREGLADALFATKPGAGAAIFNGI